MDVVLWAHSKVFSNFRIEDRHLHRLERAFPDSTFIRCQSKEQFLEALPRADIVCSFSFKAECFGALVTALKRNPGERPDYFVEEDRLLPAERLEEALTVLLEERPLCEAYLDVFREEPLAAESPLRNLPNCLILPHISANSPEYIDLFVEELIERLAEPLAE